MRLILLNYTTINLMFRIGNIVVSINTLFLLNSLHEQYDYVGLSII